MNALGTIAIVIMGVIGYLFMAQAMSEYSTFRYPKLILALVAMLGCIGLGQGGNGLASVLLIPFAALMVAGGAVWAAACLSGQWTNRGKHSEPGKTSKTVNEATPNATHNPWRAAE